MEIIIKENPQEVAKAFAEMLASEIQDITQPYHIALSGGSTPKIVFDYIAQHFSSLPWQYVHLWWGDERCVAPDHDDSNYKMTKTHLLSKINIPEANVHRIKGENNPTAEAQDYSAQIATYIPSKNQLPVFDLVMLGMGDDGHTLSIFPHEIHLVKENKICVTATHPSNGQTRVTLTVKAANQARKIVFLVTGANKADKVSEIIRRNGQYKNYPASFIKPDDQPLIWMMDTPAAAKLK